MPLISRKRGDAIIIGNRFVVTVVDIDSTEGLVKLKVEVLRGRHRRHVRCQSLRVSLMPPPHIILVNHDGQVLFDERLDPEATRHLPAHNQ